VSYNYKSFGYFGCRYKHVVKAQVWDVMMQVYYWRKLTLELVMNSRV